ncbi:MAG: response regulator, partial [Verrucomicrobia bacterium]|nr:response regulator [Verrucomicrobiota bacterium]
RLRALGQMASGIAHDFNNALTPVLGFTELLLVSPGILDDKKKAVGYLEIIRTAAADAADIVTRLRECHRQNERSDVFVPVDLKKVVSQSILLTQPKWKDQAQANGVSIHVREQLEDVPAVAGEESGVREILTNLIFNAVDAMPNGGILTLRTHSDGEGACFEVSDTGTGMSEEVRARCLEPFFSTKAERGTGLGLAMVFGIVQRHKGKIDIQSELGKGTTFIVSLPRYAGDAMHDKTQNEMAANRPLNILVVDDEPQICDVISAYLGVDGHHVETASGGMSGLQRFLDGRFDLVITDQAMPGMSGDQMAVAIKQFSPEIPVILLSGFNSPGVNEPLPGISAMACKPITMFTLRETINKVVQSAA